MSNSKKSRYVEDRGFDLIDLSFMNDKTETRSLSKSSVVNERSFQILERRDIIRRKINSNKMESEKGYE